MEQRSILNVSQQIFEKEQNEVLNYTLHSIYKLWDLDFPDQEHLLKEVQAAKNEFFLELYITSDCNQACEYCYLSKYGDKLYPKEYRDNKTILKNLDMLLSYYLQMELNLPRIDIFSGEIWGYPLGNKVFDILLKYIRKGLRVNLIVIPSNLSFCRNEATIEVVQNYLEQFRNEHIPICFSCSMDGIVIDRISRPFVGNQEKELSYYQNIFDFCKKNDFGYHPMIDADTIEYQKENYLSWLEIIKHQYDNPEELFGLIMQLEVRSSRWTKDKIISYLDWLNFVCEEDFKLFFNSDPHKFAEFIYLKKVPKNNLFGNTYMPYALTEAGNSPTCTIGGMLCVRLGDLAIAPCHRTSYEKFLFGKYEVKDDKIVGVTKGNNIALMNSLYRSSVNIKPGCGTCPYVDYCLKGCLGNQYEENKEIFYPVPENCQLQKAKIIFCLEKYKKMQLKNYIDERNTYSFQELYDSIITTEEYAEWQPIIAKII